MTEERFRNGLRDVLMKSKNIDEEEINEEQVSRILEELLEDEGSEKLNEMIISYRRDLVKRMVDEEGNREEISDGADIISLERDECIIPSCDRNGKLESIDDLYTEFGDEHVKVTLCERHLNKLKEAN